MKSLNQKSVSNPSIEKKILIYKCFYNSLNKKEFTSTDVFHFSNKRNILLEFFIQFILNKQIVSLHSAGLTIL